MSTFYNIPEELQPYAWNAERHTWQHLPMRVRVKNGPREYHRAGFEAGVIWLLDRLTGAQEGQEIISVKPAPVGEGKQRVVPGEVAAAVVTRRVELLSPLKGRVARGESLSTDEQAALLGLVEDAIREAEADDARRRDLVARVRNLRGQARGLAGSLEDFLHDWDGLR